MAVNIQSSGNFQKLVGLYEYPLLEYWVDKYTDAIKQSMIPELFSLERSSNAAEAISELTGAPEFTKWDGEYTYGEQKEGNTKVWIPMVWQAGMAYDRFLLENAKLINLKTDHGKFALAAARVKEACAAGLFTYADKTSYDVNGVNLNWTLTADGKSLANATHTSANYGKTQSNLSNLELTDANLEAACQAMYDLKDENGNDANLQPDTLVVPTYLRKRALEIIGGTGKVDTADNNPNIYYGSMKLIVWKQFKKQASKTGYPWAVIDSEAAKESAKWINRLPGKEDYEIKSWKNEEIESWRIGALMWYVAGMYDWRPFHFSIPA